MEFGRAASIRRRSPQSRLVMMLGVVVAVLSCHDDAPEPLSPLLETAPPQQAQAGFAEADRATLVEFHRATGGDRWRRRGGWLSDDPIGEWHGVTAEGGRVVRLDLADNNLRGRLPKVVAELSGLRVLRLNGNRLWGGIPPELGDLSELRELELTLNLLSGAIPPELKRLSRLRVLGLRFAGLEGPLPAWLGELTELRELGLSGNYFDSPIPPELGNLRNLTTLYLAEAELWGPIPPELGGLSSLGSLHLVRNHFSGSIPPSLGRLEHLTQLFLSESNVGGAIPAELGNLANLESLWLNGNELTGPIPSALGGLVNLEDLLLSGNRLSDSLPAELGALSKLEQLHLSANGFEGGVPPEWGEMSSLRELLLGLNPALSGALPRELARLGLTSLDTEGTGLCVPEDPVLTDWLEGVAEHSARRCNQGDLDAYLVQATQSRAGIVPLVAGRRAMLRAFVTAADIVERFPDVRASFYRNGAPEYVLDVPGKPGPVPGRVDEADAARSVNALVPGWVIQPGLEMAIEVDPNGEVDDGVAMTRRIPAEGRIEVDVREMPDLELTVVPWVWPNDPDEEIVDFARALSPDSEIFWETRTLLPVGEIDLTVHDPVHSSSNSGFQALDGVLAVRAMEGGSGYWMALTAGVDQARGITGVAYRGEWASWSTIDGHTIAHELGHNMSLGHAPCGVGGDPRYPHADGSVGTFGFDFDTGLESVVHPASSDFMSYCGPSWVGGWHFENMVRHRLRREAAPGGAGAAEPSMALLLWGGRDGEGGIRLNPAFWVAASYSPPPSRGEYEATGWSATGERLFAVRFDMTEMEDAEGRAGFAFALPARPEWADALAEISLRGVGGARAVLNRNTDRPSVILRDAATGRVRALLIDAPAAAMAAAGDGAASSLADASLVAARSRGLPEPAGWRSAAGGSAASDSASVAHVVVTPGAATLGVGDTVRLAATALDADSAAVEGVEFEWNSGDSLVAAVDRSGLVTARGTGSTVVTAAAGEVSGAAEMRIEQRPVTVAVTPAAARISAGDTVRLAATALDADGSALEGVAIEWSSSDKSVAWVDRGGLVFGWSGGSATIEGRTERGVSGSAEVAVQGELGEERMALSRLYFRLGGRNWSKSRNWLTDAPVGDWHGVTVDSQSGRVSELYLEGNGLRGQLGPELGALAGLESLNLGNNTIRGGIPRELWSLERLENLNLARLGLTGGLSSEIGNLSRLWDLDLSDNGLSGPIPPAIGQLENLLLADLSNNALEGPIPPEVTTHRNLGSLDLSGNRLTGELPANLDDMRNLQHLRLGDNRFTGELPASLGDVELLATLGLANNRLAGTLPASLGELGRLEVLSLDNNAGLHGPLPSDWVDRNQTVAVTAAGTEVCAPRHAAVTDWLRANDMTYLPVCAGEEAAFAYLVQSVQSRRYPTPLVAGEDALLRVFMSTAGDADIPRVRATFHSAGHTVHIVEIPGRNERIAQRADEGDLSKSVNAVVPGGILQPGLEMVVEIDPDGTLGEGLGIPRRIPAEGRTPVDVRAVPVLDLTAIPFMEAENPDSTVLERANDLRSDTSLSRVSDQLLPVGDVAVTVHEPILTTPGEYAWDLLHKTELVRVMEGGDGYYMGLFGHIRSGVVGQASYIGGRSFVTLAHPHVLAHELGHAMNLLHTPCGVRGDDPHYPWRDGSTGSWGYDFATNAVVPPEANDIMGYCGRQWISPYHFLRALDHRGQTETEATAQAAAEPVLLVWGGVDTSGKPFLKPAFFAEAPPNLPAAPGGEHRLTVHAGGGGTPVFSLDFDMPETAHLDGASAFVFAVPAPAGWAGIVGNITLEGPGGAAVLDPETNRPAIILRDPDTGRVRGLLIDPPAASMVEVAADRANSPWSGLDVVLSGGLPDVPQERR